MTNPLVRSDAQKSTVNLHDVFTYTSPTDRCVFVRQITNPTVTMTMSMRRGAVFDGYGRRHRKVKVRRMEVGHSYIKSDECMYKMQSCAREKK